MRKNRGETEILEMLHRCQSAFFRCALWLELVVAVVIFIGVVWHLLGTKEALFIDGGLNFTAFLQDILEILIGLELIMMLCRHDLDSVIEVMIFAVTKALLVNHENSTGMLVGALALAVLFAIRKFLVLSEQESEEREKHGDQLQKEE